MPKLFTKIIENKITPIELFSSFNKSDFPFFLDSGMDREKLGRYSFLGHSPFLRYSVNRQLIKVEKGQKTELHNGNGFDELALLLKKYSREASYPLPFLGGAVGFFGYEMGRQLEKLPESVVNDITIEDAFFAFYNNVYAFDHKTNEWHILSWEDDKQKNQIPLMEDFLNNAKEEREDFSVGALNADMKKSYYLKSIEKIKNYILSGDIYQANFTQRFSASFQGDPISLYKKLHKINPAPFAAYITTENGTILSSSPERYLRFDGKNVETRPIKGTRPRGENETEDNRLKEELINSEKDRAELLMIVDLERNDIGRIAKTGTVNVPELFVIESYPTVHHLVATVTGELKEDKNVIDAFKAGFPGGSITGAPKIRSMEIIDELELTERKVYTGSIGYFSFHGHCDSNIAIRTIILCDNKASFQVGGGITWDSDAEAEYQESLDKGKALAATLGADISNFNG